MTPGDHQPLDFGSWEPALHWICWALFMAFAIILVVKS